MIVTEKDREIRNWINKNKDKHKWVTHTMLDLYAKHYYQEQVKTLNIDDVSNCCCISRDTLTPEARKMFNDIDKALEKKK